MYANFLPVKAPKIATGMMQATMVSVSCHETMKRYIIMAITKVSDLTNTEMFADIPS